MSLEPAYIALGSNLENPAEQLRAAVEELAMLPDTRLAAVSSFYSNPPAGYADQPDYVNAVAKIETALEPRALLDALLGIERRFGRSREFQNAPRTLDLDIVLYAQRIVDEPGLTIPHPRMHERAFVVVPLVELEPDALIPGRGPVSGLLDTVDSGSLTKLPQEE